MMTSKERVLKVFNHEIPDQIPRWCGSSPEFWQKAKIELNLNDEQLSIRFGDDFRRIIAYYEDNELATLKNPTPFRIERTGIGCGQATNHPLANAKFKDIEEYTWPDVNKVNIKNLRNEALKYVDDFAILGGEWSPFWHDIADLLGMQNLFIKMYTDPDLVHVIFDKIIKYYLGVNQRIFEEAADLIDIFFIGNDFGSNRGALIGEDLFRIFILPHLKRLIDLGHSFGLKVMLHCCGGFKELIPALIEINLDALHAIQPSCHGMDLQILKKEFGDRIIFNGCIDSQKVLIEGSTEYVKEQTIETITIMKKGGNFIAGASHDYILEETPVENVLTMFDTIAEYGKY